MIEFDRAQLDNFLGVIRKYMQLRGGLSQKDLSEMTGTGISTMSRFLSKKTKELDAQLVAKLVAKLEIPLHEVIDFVEEDSTIKFKKLVQFYKEDEQADKNNESEAEEESFDGDAGFSDDDFEESMADVFESEQRTQATVKVGGKSTTIPFGGDERRNQNSDFRDKLKGLSLRQKAFVSNFLDVDNEHRDVIVDVGNQLLSYFKQRGVQF
jgi:transcriptional regulator with XRE-family HTH domain